MTPAYIAKLGFKVCLTVIRPQKIDDLFLETFVIDVARFQTLDNFDRACFFKKTFLLANISIKMGFKIFLFIFRNINV